MENNLEKTLTLIFDMPFLVSSTKPFPPLKVLNNLLNRGEYDCGMGGSYKWIPMVLSYEEYINLFGMMKIKNNKLIFVDPPVDIEEFELWKNWIVWREAGEKAHYLRDLMLEGMLLQKRIIHLENNDFYNKANNLKISLIEINSEIYNIINFYIRNEIRKDNKIFFYSTKNEYGFLSNFYKSPFNLDGKHWATVEHYFQAKKFAGTPYEEVIRLAATPTKAAQLGRSRAYPICADWEETKEKIMLDALREKLNQNELIKRKLIQTNDMCLIEHTDKDRYWGDGGDGSGKNRLGILLMQVRN